MINVSDCDCDEYEIISSVPLDHRSSARDDWVPGANQIHSSGTSLLSASSPSIDYLPDISLILEFPLNYWAEASKRSAMPIVGLPTTSS